jgi:hypothetical protein
MGLINRTDEQYYLGPDSVWNNLDETYGDYQFISMKDIINNFMIAYVGEDKVISKLKRTDVAFHAQRGLQELSYDTLPSSKTQEIEVSPQLYMILPKDYVNYIKLSWMDRNGIEHTIYPAIKTSNPKAIIQDDNHEYTFDNEGEIVYADQSETSKTFIAESGFQSTDENYTGWDIIATQNLGSRYGSNPENMHTNGTFYFDPVRGTIHFSSDLVGKIITLKYLSDGLGTDGEMVLHKFAEEAIYKYIAYAVLSTRVGAQEYLIHRFKKEFHAARRNAKIRLSNMKIEEITQIMRNKSKQLKH